MLQKSLRKTGVPGFAGFGPLFFPISKGGAFPEAPGYLAGG